MAAAALVYLSTSGPDQRGFILRALHDVQEAETLLVEEPIFMSRDGGLEASDDFARLPRAVQNSILDSNFCPLKSKRAEKLKSMLAKTSGKILDNSELDRLFRFRLVLHFNGFRCTPVIADGSGADDALQNAVALYPLCGKAAHSCAPNASWYTRDRSGTRVLRSLKPIAKDDEVFISYLSESDLLLPTKHRLALLDEQKEFSCACERCSSVDDDARVFPCSSVPCSGFHVSQRDGSWGPCNRCAIFLSEAAVAEMEEHERRLTLRLNCMDRCLAAGLLQSAKNIQGLHAIHPLHYLSRRLARVCFKLSCQDGDSLAAVQALEFGALRWLDPHAATSLSSAVALDLEILADVLCEHNEVRAEAVYQKALDVHSLLYEDLHPYRLCCQRKLAALRLRRPHETSCIWKNGMLVVLRGMTPELNGAVGELQSEEDGLWHVSGLQARARCDNLLRAELVTTRSSLGSCVLRRAGFGEVAHIVEFTRSASQVTCRCQFDKELLELSLTDLVMPRFGTELDTRELQEILPKRRRMWTGP